MFSKLNEQKLSSKYQDAHVFYYPGATVNGIAERFQADDSVKKVDPLKVSNIVLMCGSNNVDQILGSPRNLREQLLVHKDYKNKYAVKLLDKTNRDIDNISISVNIYFYEDIHKDRIVNCVTQICF